MRPKTLLLLLAPALALVPVGRAEAAPLSITVERKANLTCTANLPLRIARGDCQTRDLAVRIPAGTVPVKYQVPKATGCPAVPAIIRTKGPGSLGASFTRIEAPAGGTTSQVLSQNLSKIDPQDFVASTGTHTVHVEVPFDECPTLGTFRVKVTFPKISAPKETSAKRKSAKRKKSRKRARGRARR